jgi:hypothetical protein
VPNDPHHPRQRQPARNGLVPEERHWPRTYALYLPEGKCPSLATYQEAIADSIDPRTKTASIGFDGIVAAGDVEPEMLKQIQRFIELNRRVLLDYWDYRIDTDELRRRLRSIEDEQ